jgi:hypothetical protein
MCAHTVAASVLSVANTISNVIVRPYIETRHLRRCTQIHPSLPLVLLLAAELGATSVVRGVLGVRGVVTASTLSES